MTIRLSHSQSQTYMQCARKWKYKYIDRLMPYELKSSLFFGRKIENGIDVLLLRKKKNKTKEEEELSKKCPKEEYLLHYDKVDLDGDIFHPADPVVSYFKSDIDLNILSDETKDSLHEFGKATLKTFTNTNSFMDNVNVKKLTFDSPQKLFFNMIAYESLKQKGLLLLEDYEKTIYPQIAEVKDVQIEVNTANDEGDSFIGYIDFIASFIDEPEVFYICDNKTASRSSVSKNYKDGCVEVSEQLASYCDITGYTKAAYIVLEKEIRKRDPKTRLFIKKGEVSQETKDLVFDNYEKVLYSIKDENYEKNLDSGCFFYGSPCEYYDLCHNEGKENNLVKKK